MIDPRLIMPEAIAPSTDIVTPSPQYYGEGTVRGGQVQLGDVYGQRPRQSQEEYLFQNLASMAQSSMSMFTFPAQMQEAEKQREQAEEQKNTKHDQDKLLEYQIAQAELDQAKLNGEQTFKWGAKTYDINDPELFSSLQLEMQESILGSMITKAGNARAAEIKTLTLQSRNQDIDSRIAELEMMWVKEMKRFDADNFALDPPELYEAYNSDPELSRIRNLLYSYRNSSSPQWEQAFLRIHETDSAIGKSRSEAMVAIGTQVMQMQTGEVVNQLPTVIPMLSDPDAGPVAIMQMLNEFPNFKELLPKIGITKGQNGNWEIQSGSLLDQIHTKLNPRDVRTLVETIVDHSLSTMDVFSNEAERASFSRRLVSSYSNSIAQTTTTLNDQRIKAAGQAIEIGNNLALIDYFKDPETPIPEGIWKGRISYGDVNGSASLAISGLNHPENKRTGVARLNFVLEIGRQSVYSNIGKPDVPLNDAEKRLAVRYWQVNSIEELIEQGIYEERDGKIYLSSQGQKLANNQINMFVREVVNSNAYIGLLRQELGSIENDNRYNPSIHPTIDSLKEQLNGTLLKVIKTYLPVSGASDEDLLIAMGLEDIPEGKDFPTTLQQWRDEPILERFVDTAKTILNRFHENRTATLKSEKEMPDGYEAYNTDDLEKILGDDSRTTVAIAHMFNEALTKAKTNEEKAAVIKKYASYSWMTPTMMSMLVAKSTQLDNRVTFANYAIARLKQGQLFPADAEQIDISMLDLIEAPEVESPNSFWLESKYFDPQKGRFTLDGAKAFAIWATHAISSSPSESNITNMQMFLDQVFKTEMAEIDNPTSQLVGYPSLIMAEFVTFGEAVSAGNAATLHFSAQEKYPLEISYEDPETGEMVTVDKSFSPEASQRMATRFVSYFTNASERTSKTEVLLARNIAHQLRGVDGFDRSVALDMIKRNARMYAAILSIGPNDTSNSNSEIFNSGGPIGPQGERTSYPSTASNWFMKTKNALAMGDHDSVIAGLVSLSNFTTPYNSPFTTVTDDNRTTMYKETMMAAAMYLSAQDIQMYFQVPELLADFYNSQETDKEFHITTGQLLPLFSTKDDRNILTILSKMSPDDLGSDGIIWDTRFGSGTKEDNPFEWELINNLLGMYFNTLNTPIPGSPRPMISEIAPALAVMQADNVLIPSKTNSVSEKLLAMHRYITIADSFARFNGFWPSLYQDYKGLSFSGDAKRITLPPAYHYEGSPIHLGWGRPFSVENSDGDRVPLFANKENEIAASFFLARPSTSKNQEEFSEARKNYFISEIITPNLWNRMNTMARDNIMALASGDSTNIEFFKEATKIAEKYLPENSFFPPNLDGLVFNNAGLPDGQYINNWNTSGWGLKEDPRNSASGFALNKNGHMVIERSDSPGTNLPLSPDIMRLIDLNKLGERLINQEEDVNREFDKSTADAIRRRLEARDKAKRKEISLSSPSDAIKSGPRGMAAQALGMTAVAYLPPNNKIASEIIGSEGFSSSPKKVDRKGDFFTVGHGHLLDGSERSRKAFKEAFPDKNYDEFMAGKGTLTKEEAFLLFEKDIPTYIERAKKFTNKHGRLKFEDHTEELQIQLISATYRGSWGKSPKARKYLSEGKYEEAAKEFLDNKEYKDAATDPRIFGIRARMEKVAEAIRTEPERKRRLEEERKRKLEEERRKKEQSEKIK